MREKIAFILIFIVLCISSGAVSCVSRPAVTGDESLVESRIIAAINAERNRWTQELSQQLTDGLSEVDRRVGTVEGGLQQIATAAREYRQFVLEIISRLSEPTVQVQSANGGGQDIRVDIGGMDSS